ncbi:MAG: IcmT/TraK family protein [Rhodospirillaceae bacterium]|nr:IcmT/TraK family protein [Rhodospirillaceae bacterium]
MTIPWRDSARPVRLSILDARLIAPAGLWLFWPTWTTTALLVLLIVLFRLAETRGYRLTAALRAVRVRLAGKAGGIAPHRIRRFTDFG